jgi:hypothetical protein
MTSKEKAEDLLSIFAKIIPASSYEAYEGGVKINFDLENAKQCALIAVDEILESHYKLLSGVNTSIYKYWQEVKNEINLL